MKKFFVKQSRPSKREKELTETITSLLRKAELEEDKTAINVFENFGVVRDEQGLEKMLTAIKHSKNGNAPKVEKTVINQQNQNTMSIENENQNQEQQNVSEEETSFIEEETVQFEPIINVHQESELANPVVEREGLPQDLGNDNPAQNGEQPNVNSGETFSDDGNGGFEPPNDDEVGGDTGGGNMKDMPPETKRKAIKKTAEIVSEIYQGALPMLPKWIAKIPEAKMQSMAWNNEINLDMRIPVDTENGRVMTTVGDYIGNYNASVDALIKIDDKMKEEFRVCLKDVLEEKQVAMTPTQRLGAIVIAQAFTLFGGAIELSMRMKKQMEMFKTWHEESKPNGGGGNNNNPSGGTTVKNPVNPAKPVTPSAEEKIPEKKEEVVQEVHEEDMTVFPPDEAVVKE